MHIHISDTIPNVRFYLKFHYVRRFVKNENLIFLQINSLLIKGIMTKGICNF